MNDKKNKKLPTELLVKSVLEELKLETTGTASKVVKPTSTKSESEFGRAFFGAFDPSKVKSKTQIPQSEIDLEPPKGLFFGEEKSDGSEVHEKSINKIPSDNSEIDLGSDKTAMLADIDKTSVLPTASSEDGVKTAVLSNYKATVVLKNPASASPPDEAKTVIAGSPQKSTEPTPEVKAAFSAPPKVTPYDASLSQAEGLRIAQARINELEKEIDSLRKENELLASAGEIAKAKTEELGVRVQSLERAKNDLKEQGESELKIFRDGITSKEAEIARLREKIQELESRLGNDLKKIRVRERELENRLELAKIEKAALVKSKDETILDYKRKIDELHAEVEGLQAKVLVLNNKIESNQEQFGRTVRALRLALTNLEVSENTTTSTTLATTKKAE